MRGPLRLRSELSIVFLLKVSSRPRKRASRATVNAVALDSRFRGNDGPTLFAENPAENRVDVLQMIGRVERRVDCLGVQVAGDLGIGFELVGESGLGIPGGQHV